MPTGGARPAPVGKPGGAPGGAVRGANSVFIAIRCQSRTTRLLSDECAGVGAGRRRRRHRAPRVTPAAAIAAEPRATERRVSSMCDLQGWHELLPGYRPPVQDRYTPSGVSVDPLPEVETGEVQHLAAERWRRLGWSRPACGRRARGACAPCLWRCRRTRRSRGCSGPAATWQRTRRSVTVRESAAVGSDVRAPGAAAPVRASRAVPAPPPRTARGTGGRSTGRCVSVPLRKPIASESPSRTTPHSSASRGCSFQCMYPR